MRASDLKVLELLDFRADEGVIAFHDQRMLLYDADVIGILRRELVETVGPKAAGGRLTRRGWAGPSQGGGPRGARSWSRTSSTSRRPRSRTRSRGSSRRSARSARRR